MGGLNQGFAWPWSNPWGLGPYHPGGNPGRSFVRKRCSLQGVLVKIQAPDRGCTKGSSFENQSRSLIEICGSDQAVLSFTGSAVSQPAQVCSLCKTEPGELVILTQQWKEALWVAEKRVVTRIQPLVKSAILTRYANAAYSLRQKPWGCCCKACETWIFEQLEDHKGNTEVTGPVACVWPALSEAAITGPQCFPVDFEDQCGETPGAPQETRVAQKAGANQCSQPHEGLEASPGVQPPLTQGTSQAGDTQYNQKASASGTPTRKDWCQLSDLIVQEPQFCLKAKESALLEWIERFEDSLIPGTLEHWVANRIPECLESDEGGFDWDPRCH